MTVLYKVVMFDKVLVEDKAEGANVLDLFNSLRRQYGTLSRITLTILPDED